MMASLESLKVDSIASMNDNDAEITRISGSLDGIKELPGQVEKCLRCELSISSWSIVVVSLCFMQKYLRYTDPTQVDLAPM